MFTSYQLNIPFQKKKLNISIHSEQGGEEMRGSRLLNTHQLGVSEQEQSPRLPPTQLQGPEMWTEAIKPRSERQRREW